MIAVLAIIAIIAAATLPILIRQIDYASQGNETTNLLTMANGLQQAGPGRRYLPGTNDWATFVATNIGWQVSAVQTNLRNNPRAFLIDPTLNIAGVSAASLPFLQNSNGSTTLPTNPRFILVSSLSSRFPSGLVSGVPSTNDFNGLWNNPEDTIPTGTSWTWSSWKGQPSDIKIQRINFAPSFNHLVLTCSDPTNALYSIDNFGIAAVFNGTPVDTYFLLGTVFKLYARQTNSGGATMTNLVAMQIVREDTSWNFSGNAWRNADVPAPASGSGGTWGAIVDQFLSSTPNHGVTPLMMYTDMTNYLVKYDQYAAGNFTNTTLKTQLDPDTSGGIGWSYLDKYGTIILTPWTP